MGRCANWCGPYILRRLKTDKTVISDLPDKTEIKAFCQLSRKQAALYQQAVKELAEQLDEAEGIQRKGLVLSFLMRFKQICNHPSQWLGDGAWSEEDSGKWARLRDIAEVIAAKQEKMLVFTQFREVTAPLAALEQSEHDPPDQQHVAIAQVRLGDAPAVDEGTVGAAVVEHARARAARDEDRVASRHRGLVEAKVGRKAAAMCDHALAQRDGQRLRRPLDLDVAPGRRRLGQHRLLARALIQARDRVDALG